MRHNSSEKKISPNFSRCPKIHEKRSSRVKNKNVKCFYETEKRNDMTRKQFWQRQFVFHGFSGNEKNLCWSSFQMNYASKIVKSKWKRIALKCCTYWKRSSFAAFIEQTLLHRSEWEIFGNSNVNSRSRRRTTSCKKKHFNSADFEMFELISVTPVKFHIDYSLKFRRKMLKRFVLQLFLSE